MAHSHTASRYRKAFPNTMLPLPLDFDTVRPIPKRPERDDFQTQEGESNPTSSTLPTPQKTKKATRRLPFRCTIIHETTMWSHKSLTLYAQTPDGDVKMMTAVYESTSFFHRTGVFRVIDHTDGKDKVVAEVSSPGWFADKSIFHNTQPGRKTEGVVIYKATSRGGSLMDVECILPKIKKSTSRSVIKDVDKHTILGLDIAKEVTKHVGSNYWAETVTGLTLDNCKEYTNNNACEIMHNKKPAWNPSISAYTLEFENRALVPSVHNFQLETTDSCIVLQLGKVENGKFNMDFGYPLSIMQAFCICISVMQRTFVHD